MGPLSWILLLLALNGAVMSTLLLTTEGNRPANILLAWLIGLIALRLLIYVLGFAGVYDEEPWITFVPLDASLAFGPLLWLYVMVLTRGALPRNWRWHLVFAAIQLAYSAAAFLLPLEAKLRWFRGPHLELVEPVGLGALLISSAVYLAASWHRQRSYQQWLDQRFSSRERWRLGWLSTILAAFTVTLVATVAATLINFAVTPLDYFARTPVIFVTALLAYALGLLGWRHSALDLPRQPWPVEEAQVAQERRPSRPATAFASWAHRIEQEGWWREEGLTLAALARRLATSERTLSRALKDGAGCTFHDFINGLRVDAAMESMRGRHDKDLLTIALESGFSSKASFNRAFRRRTGMTPSQWRSTALQSPPITLAGAN